jgi:hypothetical protein
MAIIESGGKSYGVFESLDEVSARLRSLLDGSDDASSAVELDLVDGGVIFVSATGSVLAVTETPRAGRSVGFGGGQG